MKVVIVNTSERTGGAAIAANRLMKALISNGIEAKYLVLKKQSDDANVISIQNSTFKKYYSKFNFLWERLIIFICNRFSHRNLFKISIANAGFDISDHPLIKSADIINLHWINHGFLSLKNLKQLIDLNKPIVWTMHDMWPYTGICHHARECTNYQNECDRCFYLHSSNLKDISNSVFLKKKKILQYKNISYIGCSRWIEERAKLSSLTQEENVYSIPNPIDTSVFKKIDKEKVRECLKFPHGKYLLLFGAVNVTDKRKGLDYLIEGLKSIKLQFPAIYNQIELVVFGQIKLEIRPFFDVPIHIMSFLKDENTIVNLYNAVDLFVTSSLDENLPNTIMEAMACGTPCVGFNTGGIPEMIDHLKNGYVAKYKDAEDLAKGIIWTLEQNPMTLSESAVQKVEKNYAQNIVAKKYVQYYRSLINQSDNF